MFEQQVDHILTPLNRTFHLTSDSFSTEASIFVLTSFMNSTKFSLISLSFEFWEHFWFIFVILINKYSDFSFLIKFRHFHRKCSSCSSIAFLLLQHPQTFFRSFLQNENCLIVSSRYIYFPHMQPSSEFFSCLQKIDSFQFKWMRKIFLVDGAVKHLQNFVREAFGGHRI